MSPTTATERMPEVESFTQEGPERTGSEQVARPAPSGRFRSDYYRDRPQYSGASPQRDLDTWVDRNLSIQKPVSPRFRPSSKPLSSSTFTVRQKWEGVVLEIKSESFVARLHDSDGTEMDEEAELDLQEVVKDDLKLLEPGAVFYWSIGYYTTTDGQIQRASHIRFRRMPAWTKRELEQAEREADDMLRYLGDPNR